VDSPAGPRSTPASATARPGPGSPPPRRSGAGVDGRVDLRKLGVGLFERGCRRVLLEGGPTLAGAYLREGLVDEVVGYVAPQAARRGPGGAGHRPAS
jgi:diaminohydroxyphosphoribosylaminopyrimidine deaminase/5-amino-6-(5-phosphoribosylamino)uracil reductase